MYTGRLGRGARRPRASTARALASLLRRHPHHLPVVLEGFVGHRDDEFQPHRHHQQDAHDGDHQAGDIFPRMHRRVRLDHCVRRRVEGVLPSQANRQRNAADHSPDAPLQIAQIQGLVVQLLLRRIGGADCIGGGTCQLAHFVIGARRGLFRHIVRKEVQDDDTEQGTRGQDRSADHLDEMVLDRWEQECADPQEEKQSQPTHRIGSSGLDILHDPIVS
mmetsp:Transcript_31422/g.62435  ORF Transcript_31422/g.62435 Transcript_31422/m.62435 type:complete len:219 (-) Transcript_31422:568-1224(-)